MTWNVAASCSQFREREAKPKTRDGSDTNGYVYVPTSWKGERVLCLLGVDNVEISDDDAVLVTCTCEDFNRNTPTTKGTGAALSIPSEYVNTPCLILLHPTNFAMEAT